MLLIREIDDGILSKDSVLIRTIGIAYEEKKLENLNLVNERGDEKICMYIMENANFT